jgi:uncharacterized membrane protein
MSLPIPVWRYVVLTLVGLLAAYLVARTTSRSGWTFGRPATRAAAAVVAGLALLGAVGFGGLVTARYLTWHSFVHDLGSYDQKVWLVSTQDDPWRMLQQTWRGGVEVSPCGRAREWGVCHFQPLHVIPGLLYTAWASPLLLLWLQALAVASGVIPLFLFASRRLEDRAAAVGVCLLYLLFPAVQYNALLDFRPDFVAIPILLWAFELADRGHVVAALLVAASAGLMKETLILTFAGFGLFVWLRYRQRWLGLGAFGLGLLAFFLVGFQLLADGGRSEAAFLASKYFQASGPWTALRPRKLLYLAALFGPLGGLPALSPVPLLPAVPTLGISLLSSDVTHATIQSQYSSSAVGPLFIALLDVLGRLRMHRAPMAGPRPVVAGLATLSAFVAFAIGPTPLSMNFWNRAWGGHWHYTQYLPDRQDVLNRAERLIPADPSVAVVTQNDLNSARLAHRHAYYAFPNELGRADYVFLDSGRLPFVHWTPDQARYDELVEQLREQPQWRLIFDESGVLLFRHVRR